jgi:hypothetical protein
MLADALLDLSNRGDIVIDPFLGSGSTLIAADKIGNVSRGVDLDSLYVEVIMRQYAAATGNPAVLIETGEAFDALAREGQGRQRRSRAGFQTRPRHYEALETTAPSTRADACTAEVRGSNPLSSTRKSARAALGSRRPQSLRAQQAQRFRIAARRDRLFRVQMITPRS